MNKKQIRSSFRLAVFSRDRYRCRGCGIKGKDRQGGDEHLRYHPDDSVVPLDAHHITNRNDMPNGGYTKANGITVCDECHHKAEAWLQNGVGDPGFAPEDLYLLIESSSQTAIDLSTNVKSGAAGKSR